MMNVNRNTRRLRAIKNGYNNQVKRPYKTPDYELNWVLLDEGYDIIWDNFPYELHDHLRTGNLPMIKIYLKADINRIRLTDIPYTLDHSMFARLIDEGAIIESLSYVEPKTIQECENIRLNIQYLSGSQLSLELGKYDLLKEYLRATRTSYRIKKNGSLIKFPELVDSFDDLDEDIQSGVFINSCRQNQLANIQYILERDYITNIDDIRLNDKHDSPTKITILKYLNVGEDEKLQLFKRYLVGEHGDLMLFHHPSAQKYWKRLSESDYPMGSTIRNFLETGEISLDGSHSEDLLRSIDRYDVIAIKKIMDSRKEIILEELLREYLRYQEYPHYALELLDKYLTDEQISIICKNKFSKDAYLRACTTEAYRDYWDILMISNPSLLSYLEYIEVEPHLSPLESSTVGRFLANNHYNIVLISRALRENIVDHDELVNELLRSDERGQLLLLQLFNRKLIDLRSH